MISLAKKLLATGRVSSVDTPGNESRAKKYSLTSTREQTAPISGTSFSLNPEHSYVTNDWYKVSDDHWSKRATEEPLDTTDGKERRTFTVYPEISDQRTSAEEGLVSLSSANDATLISDANIENSPERVTFSHDKVIKFDPRRQNMVETSSDSQPHHTVFSTRSSCSTLDDFIDSRATISSDDFASITSADLLKAATKYQRIKAKRQSKDLRYRRKTVDNIDYRRSSPTDSLIENLARYKSKSHAPSPIDNEPSQFNQLLKVPRRSSAMRRRTVVGLFTDLDTFDSQNEALESPSSLPNAIWRTSSSEDLLTDCSSVDMLGNRQYKVDRRKRASAWRQESVVATAICINEMKRCKVIADLDLLEDSTEFEPCTMSFEDTVVLWPAAVDKPSCFECLGTNRSWISSLEATGFVGVECVVMATATLSQGSQDRALFLFLFPRHLLFAEQKSNSTLKLNRKVDVAQLWLSIRKDDIAEIAETDAISDGSRSFVVGWPPTNAALTFATSEEKMLWTTKLEDLVRMEKENDGNGNSELSVKVAYKDRGHSRIKELVVSRAENSFQFLQRCLQEFHLNGNSSKEFQLSIRWAKDQPEQPLLGHELPYLIEAWFMSCAAKQYKDNTHLQCLVLRERKRSKLVSQDAGGRTRPSRPPPLRTLFKRSQQRSQKPLPLFRQNLLQICVDNAIPKRIQAMLQYLYVHGPSTVGVFRKSGRHTELSDFKSHLNSVEEIDFENVSVDVVASAIKDWLRNLPNCLLSCALYDQWIEVSELNNFCLIQEELKRLSSILDPSHLLVLRHLMCVLHRIQLHSKYNRMTSSNLAVCIGPNILHPGAMTVVDLQANSVVQANGIVRMMIESVEYILGSDCIKLYQDLANPYLVETTEIDGEYELHPNVSTENENALTSNSLESLSNEFVIENSASTMSQSLDNMSPDSGLAASNPQLYEDILAATNNSESSSRKLQQLRKDHLSKIELFDISEDQIASNSDGSSLSSRASDYSGSVETSAQMQGSRKVCEPIQRSQNLQMTSEAMSSFEDQFSISDDHCSQSDMVVTQNTEITKEPTAVLLSSLVPENEEATRCSGDDHLTTLVLATEARDVSNTDPTAQQMDVENKYTLKSAAALNDTPTKKPEARLSRTEPEQKFYRLIDIEVVPTIKGNTLPRPAIAHEAKLTERGSTVFSVSPIATRKVDTGQDKRQHKFDDDVKITAHSNSPSRRETYPLLSHETPTYVTSHVSEQRLIDSNRGDATSANAAQCYKINSSPRHVSGSSPKHNGGRNLATDAAQLSRQNDAGFSVMVTNFRQENLQKDEYIQMQKVAEGNDISLRASEMNGRLRNPHELQKKFLNMNVTITPREVSSSRTSAADIPQKDPHRTRRIENVPIERSADTERPKKVAVFDRPKKPLVYGIDDTYFGDDDITVKSIKYRHEDVETKLRQRENGPKAPFREDTTPSGKSRNAEDRWRVMVRNKGLANTAVVHVPNPKCSNLNTQTVASRWGGFRERSEPRRESRSADRVGMQRRTTVIQLCDNNSVILQKTVKKT